MTAKNQQSTLHESHIAAATQQYIASLTAMGVNSFTVGSALSEDPEGEGVVVMQGTSTMLLNLIGAMVHRLVPGDFHTLLMLMTAGEYFAESRGEKKQPAKKEMVN